MPCCSATLHKNVGDSLRAVTSVAVTDGVTRRRPTWRTTFFVKVGGGVLPVTYPSLKILWSPAGGSFPH